MSSWQMRCQTCTLHAWPALAEALAPVQAARHQHSLSADRQEGSTLQLAQMAEVGSSGQNAAHLQEGLDLQPDSVL